MNEMNITLAKYVAKDGINTSITATVDNQTMSVPINPANRHFAEIMRQVDAGELTIADAD